MIPSNTLPPSRVLNVATDARTAQEQVAAEEAKQNQLPTAVVEPEPDHGVEPGRDPTDDQDRSQTTEAVDEEIEEELTGPEARLSPAEKAARERARVRFEDALAGSLEPQPGDQAAQATKAAAAMAHAANATQAYASPEPAPDFDSEV